MQAQNASISNFKKKRQKPAQKPDGQTHSTVTNSEEKESKEAANENQHAPERGRAGKRQVFPVKNERYEAYNDEHRKFQEKWMDEFLFVLHGMKKVKDVHASFRSSQY